MDTYSLLREIADSWVLLAMFGFFLSAVLWAFRPGGSKVYDDISRIPLRDEPTVPDGMPCKGDCAGCTCANIQNTLKGLQDV